MKTLTMTLSLFLMTFLQSFNCHGVYPSKDKFFDSLHVAGVRRVLEVPIPQFFNRKAKPFILDTDDVGATETVSHDMDKNQLTRVRELDYISNDYMVKAKMEAYQLGAVMVCYIKRSYKVISKRFGPGRKFKKCLAFPKEVESVVEKIEEVKNANSPY